MEIMCSRPGGRRNLAQSRNLFILEEVLEISFSINTENSRKIYLHAVKYWDYFICLIFLKLSEIFYFQKKDIKYSYLALPSSKFNKVTLSLYMHHTTMYYPNNANCFKNTHGMNTIICHIIHLFWQRVNTSET